MTDDQAAAIKKELDSISELLKNGQSASGSSGGNTNAVSQLSSDDRQNIRDVLKSIGKQLFASLSAQSTQATSPVDDLFAKIDTNGDKSISKNELTDFVSSMTQGGQNASDLFSKPQTYGQQGSFSLTMVSYSQSTFSVTA
jgi:hypothetical protein